MAKISQPMGFLWKLFSSQPEEPVEQEIQRLLDRLVQTPKNSLLFWPDFGVERPKENFGKNMMEAMRKYIERLYGTFFRTHNFVISLEKMDDDFKRAAFGSDAKDLKGDIFFINIHQDEVSFRIYWNFRQERWERPRSL